MPGLESDQDLFFFFKLDMFVSNKIVGQLYVCLSVVGLESHLGIILCLRVFFFNVVFNV